jgi:hypothetical protein
VSLSSAQIGRCGELLVQYELFLRGVERIEVPVILDGREIARIIADRLPSALRTMGTL